MGNKVSSVAALAMLSSVLHEAVACNGAGCDYKGSGCCCGCQNGGPCTCDDDDDQLQFPLNGKYSKSSQNLLVNGDFQSPVVQSWTIFPGGIKGWTSKNIQLGKGAIYNSQWGNTQVVELDSDSNQVMTQSIDLDGDGVYTLSFDWAARVNKIQTSGGEVYWNGKLLKNIAPSDYNIHHQTFKVSSVRGRNTLEVRGTLACDSYGLTVDNFVLTRSHSAPKSCSGYGGSQSRSHQRRLKEYIVNGNFEQPKITSSNGWVSISGSIPGWQASTIQLGQGTIYNPRWGNTQITELDSVGNQNLVQVIPNLRCGSQLTLSYKWASRVGRIATSGGNVYWNNQLIESISPQDEEIHKSSFKVTAVDGDNVLRFEGSLASDTYGLGIDDVSLIGEDDDDCYGSGFGDHHSSIGQTVSKGSGWSCQKGGKWKSQIESGHL